MVDTLTGKSPDKLEELFSTYRDLVKRQRGLEERLHKAELEKDSVDERIYEKVISGYRADLEAVKSDLKPVQNELDEMKAEVQREMDDLEPKIKVLEDELAELDFRNRVGEFEHAEYEDKKKAIDGRVDELVEQKKHIQKKIDSFDLENQSGRQVDSPVRQQDSSPDSEAASPPEEPVRTDRSAAPADQAAPDDDFAFENPNEWLDELGKDKKPEMPAVEDSAAGDRDVFMDDDPLSALADPSDERSRRESDQAEKPSGYPNLVISSGPNAGKKIPLLPMTMSVGREHDNNIELKDPEVARYHVVV